MAADRSLIVQSVAAEYPELFRQAQFNTNENCAIFCWKVCDRLATAFPQERWGLLTKSPGENGHEWPNGKRTSHDNICLPNGERFDIIGSAGDPRVVASPTWGVVSPDKWRAHNVWIDYLEVMMDGTPPKPAPEPPSENELGKALRQVNDIDTFMRQLAGHWNIRYPK